MKRNAATVFVIVNGVIALLAIYYAIRFVGANTSFVVGYGLLDPAATENRAGLNFGRIISVLFALGSSGTLFLCYKSVSIQIPAYEKTLEKWKTEGKRLQDGLTTTDEVVQELANAAPNDTRIRIALESWQDASPDSDPEYVIEGEAIAHRQWLGILQTLASVLVLIGLVGNFFGLADAVRTLPELPAAMSAPASQEVQTQKTVESQEVQNELEGDGREATLKKVVQSTTTSGKTSAPDSSIMAEKVGKISEGLQVVVISSIMGIGGMAILLMLVSFLRGLINSTIADEVVLLSAEVGSVLRPTGSAGFSEELKQGLAALPERLSSFDQAASKVTETLGRYTTDFGEVSKNLDKLLEHQLQDTQAAFKQYHVTLEQFTKVLVDQQGSVTQLTDTTKRLCDNLEGISKSVKSVADQSANVGDRLNEIQLQYETYLRAATDDIMSTREVVTKLHEKIIDDADERMSQQAEELRKAMEKVTNALTSRTRAEFSSLVQDLISEMSEQTNERHSEMLAQLSAVSKEQLQQYDAQLERMDSLLTSQKLLHETAEQSRDRENSASSSLLEAADSLKEAREVLSSHRDKLVQVYDALTHRQDLALRELIESWKASFEAESKRVSTVPDALSTVNEKLENVTTQLAEFVGLLGNISASGGEVTLSPASVDQLRQTTVVPPTGEAAPRVAVPSRESIEKALQPLVEETKRLIETIGKLETLPSTPSQQERQAAFTPPSIENPKCPQCGTVNKEGVLQCRDCSARLNSGGIETLNALVRQLIETMDERPLPQSPGSVSLGSDLLLEEVKEQRRQLSDNQDKLIVFLSDMPLNIKQAVGPEIATVSAAVERLTLKIDEVAQSFQTLNQSPGKRKKHDTRNLDDEPDKQELRPEETEQAAEPELATLDSTSEEETKTVPTNKRWYQNLFRKKS